MKRWKLVVEFEIEGRTREEVRVPDEMATLIKSPYVIPGTGKITVQEIERPLLDRFLDAARMQP